MKKIPVLFFLLLWSCFSAIQAEDLTITDAEENDINIQVYPSDTDQLIIWLVDHDQQRPTFEKVISSVNQAGFEIWRIDLLADYFLPRSGETERTLGGEGVAAVIKAAHDLRDKKVLMVAYDRMPLATLRGIQAWLQDQPQSDLVGSALLYPNLFGPSPVAGLDPVIDPVISNSTLPLVIFQPQQGSQRWRANKIMQAFWEAGTPAFIHLVPGVRDWYIMHKPEEVTAAEKTAQQKLPGQLKQYFKLFEDYPVILHNTTVQANAIPRKEVYELVKFKKPVNVPGFNLKSFNDETYDWSRYAGKVTLVNFWATWCPPCVEEIPSLNQLAAHFRDSEFSVVSIDYRESKAELKKFTDKIPVDFPVLMDLDGKASLQWKIFSFPSSFLVDKKGQVRYSANRAIDWNADKIHTIVEQLLQE